MQGSVLQDHSRDTQGDNLYIQLHYPHLHGELYVPWDLSAGVNGVNKVAEPLRGEIRKLKPNASREGVGWVHSSLCSVCIFQLKGKWKVAL